jgi:hypothetical protein
VCVERVCGASAQVCRTTLNLASSSRGSSRGMVLARSPDPGPRPPGRLPPGRQPAVAGRPSGAPGRGAGRGSRVTAPSDRGGEPKPPWCGLEEEPNPAEWYVASPPASGTSFTCATPRLREAERSHHRPDTSTIDRTGRVHCTAIRRRRVSKSRPTDGSRSWRSGVATRRCETTADTHITDSAATGAPPTPGRVVSLGALPG